MYITLLNMRKVCREFNAKFYLEIQKYKNHDLTILTNISCQIFRVEYFVSNISCQIFRVKMKQDQVKIF